MKVDCDILWIVLNTLLQPMQADIYVQNMHYYVALLSTCGIHEHMLRL